jgi:hypothetical protein
MGYPLKTVPLILCAAALACGIAAMLVCGITPPAWLAGLEAALLAGAALIYGFTAYLPALPRWLWLRPVRGTVLVILGMGAMYVPPQLLLSAYLIGVGVRLVWQSACELAERDGTVTGVVTHVDADADRLPVSVRAHAHPAGQPPARQQIPR